MVLIDVNARVVYRHTGRALLIPILVGEQGILMPLLRYFEHIRLKRSNATLNKIRHAVRLFFLYVTAIRGIGFVPAELQGRDHAVLFQRFRAAIVHGTIDETSRDDPTGLWWSGSGVSKANRAVFYLTDFFDWLVGEIGGDVGKFNPTVGATPQDELISRAAYEHRRSRAFLGHTWESSDGYSATARFVSPISEPRRRRDPSKRFPEHGFQTLLRIGFGNGSLSNLRDILITVLMNKGGLRISEVLHIWVTDIQWDHTEGLAHVVIPHPADGVAPASWSRYGNRRNCLEAEFRRRPRSELGSDPEYAGWKSGLLKIEVLWCEPAWGAYFWRLWQVYARRIQQVVPASRRSHPYAFVCLDGPTLGRPMTTAAFRDSHRRAVERAGLIPPAEHLGLKNLGLTGHGHRHAYGHRAKNDFELPRELVRDLMNHESIESQDVYTRRSWSDVMQLLKASAARLVGTYGPSVDVHKLAELAIAGLEETK